MSAPSYRIAALQAITGGDLTPNAPDSPIRHLITDSRRLGDPAASLFFAIRGARRDGHDFVEEAFAAGVRHFVVSRLPDNEKVQAGSNFLLVKNPRAALQAIAAAHRKPFNIPVIGITGSNGKTVVKEWLFQLLREDRNIARSPKSYNSQIGVPLSVWQMNAANELGIFEAGISQPGEMEKLEAVIRPTLGVITNIGHAHDEHFTGHGQKAKEKLMLFRRAGTVICCKDHDVIHNILATDDAFKNLKTFTWSRRGKADLVISRVERKDGETHIQGVFNNSFADIAVPFTDDASVENAIHCWATLLHLGCAPDTIRQRMQLLSPVAMRLELKEGVNNCSVINDYYNSDPESLNIALDFLNQQKQHGRRTVILSDILQSGRAGEALYGAVAEMLSRKNVDRLIGIGPAISAQQERFAMDKTFYPSTEAFLSSLAPDMFFGETILIKGARDFGFERISKALQHKAHETVLEINLSALVHNLAFYRSRLQPGTKVMAMVKAFSYGSGTFEIANVLQFYRTDYLAVAYADEGIALRRAGITLPVMVMSPQPQSFDAMIAHTLEPEIYSMRILDDFIASVSRNIADLNVQYPVHLKLDTGMHRLGFTADDLDAMMARMRNARNLRIQSVFTHLAAADAPEHDGFTRRQLSDFHALCDDIAPHFSYDILRHAANTVAALRFPDSRSGMVRLGIGLYGIGSTPEEQAGLQNVSTLRTTISQLRKVPDGETIGYGRKGIAEKDMIIATVPVGYADGYSRRLGNGIGSMLVNGRIAPTAGNICMDMCMLDVTGLPVNEGDEVIVFGEGCPITDLAKAAGTIPYEILATVSGRVKRVYYQE